MILTSCPSFNIFYLTKIFDIRTLFIPMPCLLSNTGCGTAPSSTPCTSTDYFIFLFFFFYYSFRACFLDYCACLKIYKYFELFVVNRSVSVFSWDLTIDSRFSFYSINVKNTNKSKQINGISFVAFVLFRFVLLNSFYFVVFIFNWFITLLTNQIFLNLFPLLNTVLSEVNGFSFL